MTARKKEIEGLFDRSAPSYDACGPRFFSYFGRRLAEIAQIAAGAHILDVATGRGAALLPAAEAAGPDGLAVGIDISQHMAGETASESARYLPRRAEVLRMDAEHLGFPAETFERVLCGFGIFFFPAIDSALREMRRVLKPGGRLVFSTWGKNKERREWFVDCLKACLACEKDIEHSLRLLPRGFDEEEKIVETLEKAGFTDIRVIADEKRFYYQNEEEWWSAQWSHGMRLTLETVLEIRGEEGLNLLKEKVFEKIREMKRPEGFGQLFTALFTSAGKP